jgi:hypothetical protein
MLDRVAELLQLERFGLGNALQLKAKAGSGAVLFQLAHRLGQIVGDGKKKTIVVPKVHIEGGIVLCDRDPDLPAPEVNVGVVIVVRQVAAVLRKKILIGKGRGIEL